MIRECAGGQSVVVDIVKPEVFIGGFIGAAKVSLFAGVATKAVSIATQETATQVRRQVLEIPTEEVLVNHVDTPATGASWSSSPPRPTRILSTNP